MALVRLDQDTEDGIRELLMGRRVVAAEELDPPVRIKGSYGFHESATGKLALDDGREIYVIPNQGGCACSAGDYELASLAKVDNIITRVDLETQETPDEWGESDTAYRIFVFADNERINLLSIEGSDGDGYYGTGYELVVVDAGSAPTTSST